MNKFTEKQTRSIQVEVYPFGDKLKSLRKDMKLTQGDVAERFGKNRTTITNWEIGYNLPTLDDFIDLCVFYNITPNDLLEFDTKDKP